MCVGLGSVLAEMFDKGSATLITSITYHLCHIQTTREASAQEAKRKQQLKRERKKAEAELVKQGKTPYFLKRCKLIHFLGAMHTRTRYFSALLSVFFVNSRTTKVGIDGQVREIGREEYGQDPCQTKKEECSQGSSSFAIQEAIGVVSDDVMSFLCSCTMYLKE